MKTRFEPKLPRRSWKNNNLHALDLNSGPLHLKQVFYHWTIKARYHMSILVPFRTTKDCHSCRFGRFVPSNEDFTWAALWAHYAAGFNGPMLKILLLVQRFRVRILGVEFIYFSCWHPWETRFKSGFHSSFWDFICGTWNWGMASSFWNHVIQISIRQVHFQDIYSQLLIIKIFSENIYFLKSNTYFWGTVVFLQYGFLYLILTRPKFAVHTPACRPVFLPTCLSSDWNVSL